MEMKKKRIVYSLTGRGLFSELSNLALALVYADYNQEELTVNTRNWNARVEKGAIAGFTYVVRSIVVGF